MKSKDPDIRAAALAIYNSATGKGSGTGPADLPSVGYGFGSGLVKQIIYGMNAQQNALKTAAAGLAGTARNYFQLSSPAKEGPWSQMGGPEGWGERFTKFMARGMVRAVRNVSDASQRLAEAALPVVPAPYAGALSYEAPRTFSGRSGTAYTTPTAEPRGNVPDIHVHVEGLLKARDPLELGQRLARFAQTGVFNPPAEPR